MNIKNIHLFSSQTLILLELVTLYQHVQMMPVATSHHCAIRPKGWFEFLIESGKMNRFLLLNMKGNDIVLKTWEASIFLKQTRNS